jgi:charged multivesicular body protein 7
LASLYSDFQLQASSNPDGYIANISAWKRALVNAARAGKLPSQGATSDLLTIRTGSDLARELQSKQWGRPMALGAVVRDAVAKKELIPASDFLKSKTSIYHKSWIITPWQVLEWGLRQVGLMGGGGSVASNDAVAVGNFVIVENVEVSTQLSCH